MRLAHGAVLICAGRLLFAGHAGECLSGSLHVRRTLQCLISLNRDRQKYRRALGRYYVERSCSALFAAPLCWPPQGEESASQKRSFASVRLSLVFLFPILLAFQELLLPLIPFCPLSPVLFRRCVPPSHPSQSAAKRLVSPPVSSSDPIPCTRGRRLSLSHVRSQHV